MDKPSEDIRHKYLAVCGSRLTKIKYCATCDIYRPPRTVHCGLCNCCIERLDHHCPWLGTCIGKRNYKYFIIFITLIAVMVVKALAMTTIHILDSSFNVLEEDKTVNMEDEKLTYSTPQQVSMVLLAFLIFFGIFVFWLLGYHQYLICLNQTTNENLKGSYNKYGNPFDRGCCENLRRLFRGDKRNWKPEQHVIKEEVIEVSGQRKSNLRVLQRHTNNAREISQELRIMGQYSAAKKDAFRMQQQAESS